QSSCSFNVTVNAPTTADQTITFAALSRHVYGDAPFSLNATSSSGLAVSFNVTGNCSLSGNSLTITGAGICTVTASQPGDVNYNITFIPGTLTVTQAPLTLTANPVARYFGVNNPPLTVTFVGLLNNDTITATGVTTATPTSPPGSYPITIPLLNVVDPGQRLSNYAVTNPALPGGYATNGLLTVVLTYAVY